MKDSIETLKTSINNVFNATKQSTRHNIWRGHSRSISTDIEDNIAILIAEELPENYKLYIDPSIYIGGKIHRPDLVVSNENDEVIFVIEIKANMGWCRDATAVIDSMVNNHSNFLAAGLLDCKLSSGDRFRLKYQNNVKLFLIALTDANGGKYESNKKIAYTKGVSHYCLFSGWYNNLQEKDISSFIAEIKKF